MSNTFRSISSPCAVCAYKHKGCLPRCEYAKIFRNVIGRQDYKTIFNVFGVKNVAYFLQSVPEYQYLETLNSFLFEAKARVENPSRGCTSLILSLEQKVEELQSRVTALEARLEGESSRTNPSSSFTHPGSSFALPVGSPFSLAHPEGSSRAHPSGSFAYPFGSFAHPECFSQPLSLAENIVPNIIQTGENSLELGVLPIQEDLSQHPHYGSFLKLLESTPDIGPSTVNLSEHGTFLTEMGFSVYPTLSDYQAALNPFSLQFSQEQFSQGGAVAEVAESVSPNWTSLVDVENNIFDYTLSDLDDVLRFLND